MLKSHEELKPLDPLLLLTWEQLFSLDRQTIRAHRMEIDWTSAGIDERTDPAFGLHEDISTIAFAILFGGDDKKRLSNEDWFTFINVSPAGTYFSIWLSLLYSVLERLKMQLKKAGQNDLSFLENYSPELMIKLEGLRQTIFHVPLLYWDQKRLHEVLEPGIARSAWNLHKELMDRIGAALKQTEPEDEQMKKFSKFMEKLSD